jgi:hypothetical protein
VHRFQQRILYECGVDVNTICSPVSSFDVQTRFLRSPCLCAVYGVRMFNAMSTDCFSVWRSFSAANLLCPVEYPLTSTTKLLVVVLVQNMFLDQNMFWSLQAPDHYQTPLSTGRTGAIIRNTARCATVVVSIAGV